MSKSNREKDRELQETQNPSKLSNRNLRIDKYKTEANKVLDCNKRA